MDTSALQQNVDGSQLANDACIWLRQILKKEKNKNNVVYNSGDLYALII